MVKIDVKPYQNIPMFPAILTYFPENMYFLDGKGQKRILYGCGWKTELSNPWDSEGGRNSPPALIHSRPSTAVPRVGQTSLPSIPM